MLGKTPKETYVNILVYEDQTLSGKCVYEWFTRYREGRENVSNNLHNGSPVASVNDENILKGRILVTEDHRLTGTTPERTKRFVDFLFTTMLALTHLISSNTDPGKNGLEQSELSPYSPDLKLQTSSYSRN
ncbi:hypothetical protein TNCV_2200991 [Trichonephila clavipes]|nr:hypothetical protein TNCV_2200991 [Trichonephila clavipes]